MHKIAKITKEFTKNGMNKNSERTDLILKMLSASTISLLKFVKKLCPKKFPAI